MKTILYTFLTLFFYLLISGTSHASFSFNASNGIITISGTETGDTFRSWITTNNPVGWSVDGRTITTGGDLRILNGTHFSDTNSSYIFLLDHNFTSDNTSGGNTSRITFTDVAILYSQGQKGHTDVLAGEYIELNNVHFRVQNTAGRSDFFTYVPKEYALNNVQFISYGSNDYLHLPTTGGDLYNVTIVNNAGSLTFQPDTQNNTLLRLYDWKLRGITGIKGNGGNDLTAITEFWNLDWDNTTWTIGGSSRGQYYKVINPIKPTGWIEYRGQFRAGLDTTEEFMTHDIKIKDENNNSIQGSIIIMWNNDLSQVQYQLLTDTQGEIPQQFIKTVTHNATDDFTYHSDFKMGVYNYLYKISSGVKEFQNNPIDEVVITPTDTLISETNQSTVSAYTELDTSAKVYDRAKLWKLSNLESPSISSLPLTRAGDTIDAGSYDVNIDAASPAVFFFDGTTITIKSSHFVGNITTTGTISFQNGATYQGIMTDINGTTSQLELTGLPTGSYVYVMDDSGSVHSYDTNQSGTYISSISASATGEWTYVVKKPGYQAQIGKFSPTGGIYSYPVALSAIHQSNGVTMYAGTSSSLVDIEYSGTTQMNIDIGDGTVSIQKVYDRVEDSLVTQTGMHWLASGKEGITISNLTAGDFIFLTDGVRIRRNTSLDANATVDAFVISTQGVILDPSNGPVQFLSSTAESVTIKDSEKEELALQIKNKMEESGSLLDRILDFILDILTRIVSIKTDTQQIQ